MSGFDKTWLSLREPADRAARNSDLVHKLCNHLTSQIGERQSCTDKVTWVADLGCGSGATWRALASDLPQDSHWLLMDNDAALLVEAEMRIGARGRITTCQQDLNAIEDVDLCDVSLVTASAFFDLCSEGFCSRLIDHIRPQGCGLYAALNYNGIMEWSVPHELDAAVVDDFNRHQRTDKGFGPALGPAASAFLAEGLRARGYEVTLGDSPWTLDAEHAELQPRFLDGFRQPLLEIGTLSATEIERWLAFRVAAISRPDSSCVVGHTDLLALHD
ncbi:methyltransferase domain-containing protein [Roseibium sp.]|uniref:methyltransferase domain-containing protein n=1 Tax=Roseibium sp. TaxID=1936156 RepID=UPI003A96F731